ncbi:inner membrane protein import complex subunit Tim54-domain-containing protein [Schizophyllum amplum]|uniref:Mitochondrial import inner membrane translocase subunit TIM54 n=1 Tax=Schizophyllum amplum TaxID=97359 RepID=A0A550C3C5_9AGAR|nr:inner membrane protein import complex subunit Tim54-domain-containing protein [Auriculariopsis ampla]
MSGEQKAKALHRNPPSWLDYRPKLPSRNWLIFWTVTSTVTGYYVYDRRECKRIRQSYVERVSHLAERPLNVLEYPRKVRVYGCKWPGDEDFDMSMKYFRRYIKPILVAAGVDYETVNGKKHGELAQTIADEIRARRRITAGLDSPPLHRLATPTYVPQEVLEERAVDAGAVIIGRPAFKEFMLGLARGWTESLNPVDRDDALARALADDGHFDEPEEGEAPTPKPVAQYTPNPITPAASPDFPPPAAIPPIPPLLLVSFVDYIGFSQVPYMLWDWFNKREHVRAGAEAAYRLVMRQTRPFRETATLETPSDLAFDKDKEELFRKTTGDIPGDTAKSRERYYAELPARLAVARELARGTREPTKEEAAHPPPTEVELSQERLNKEKVWRSRVDGWEIIKPTQKVFFDERLRGLLSVYVDPEEQAEEPKV